MAAELIVEWTRVGDVVRLALFDPENLEEVVVTGPAHAPRAELERIARAKLARRLGRRGVGAGGRRPGLYA
ncbi:hypothetical protein HRbin39_01210 [bacterium HR39]|nr:hypothetical protein HRbin39_01210 [bacterium HR39]